MPSKWLHWRLLSRFERQAWENNSHKVVRITQHKFDLPSGLPLYRYPQQLQNKKGQKFIRNGRLDLTRSSPMGRKGERRFRDLICLISFGTFAAFQCTVLKGFPTITDLKWRKERRKEKKERQRSCRKSHKHAPNNVFISRIQGDTSGYGKAFVDSSYYCTFCWQSISLLSRIEAQWRGAR